MDTWPACKQHLKPHRRAADRRMGCTSVNAKAGGQTEQCFPSCRDWEWHHGLASTARCTAAQLLTHLCMHCPLAAGMGGAGVLDALNPLLQQQLGDARNQNRPYHFIVFEAGINDILMKNQKAPLIFERM